MNDLGESQSWASPSDAMHGLPYEHRGANHEIAQRLAAIVVSSEDAILTKDLDGTVASWNRGAELLFGYRAAEIIGKPVMLLLPDDRQNEEASILARLRRGVRVRHYETVRRRKDGRLVEISLSISPLRDANGAVIGASTIARDITERKQVEERQRLLLREMDHRMKNLFALAASVVGMSVRDAASPQQLASIVQERLSALARAHYLTMPKGPVDGLNDPVRLHVLIHTILAPYESVGDRHGRLQIIGDDMILPGASMTTIALILHELATNAAKYGALSSPSGTVTVECVARKDTLTLTWQERGGPRSDEPGEDGFGSLLGAWPADSLAAPSSASGGQRDCVSP